MFINVCTPPVDIIHYLLFFLGIHEITIVRNNQSITIILLLDLLIVGFHSPIIMTRLYMYKQVDADLLLTQLPCISIPDHISNEHFC